MDITIVHGYFNPVSVSQELASFEGHGRSGRDKLGTTVG